MHGFMTFALKGDRESAIPKVVINKCLGLLHQYWRDMDCI